MTADKNPIEDVVDQALDAFVYAPIGLLFDGPGRFSKLVSNGRSQVNNARVMGPFAIQQARTQVQRATADLDGPVLDLLRGLGVVPGPPPGPAGTPTAPSAPAAPAPPAKAAAKKAARQAANGATDASSNKAAAKKAATKRTAAVESATPSADVLPIPDYDSLSASQVVSRLRGLSAGQLDAVRAYETATRGRKTILNRVQQLSKP